MDIVYKDTTPHPHFLDNLFAHKTHVSRVFNDVLGLAAIHHIALSFIDNERALQTFSSTPALEFNLFSTSLWQFDKTYQFSWYSLCTQSTWDRLYTKTHYNALYYLKQIKHHYSVGFSFAIKRPTGYVIYSMATHAPPLKAYESFANEMDDYRKIGDYCSHALLPLLSPETLG